MALRIFVEHIDPKQIIMLKKEFELIDKDRSGIIEVSELSQAIKKANMTLSNEDINEIISQIDENGDGEINYSEFITATINTKDLLTDKRIEVIF
tara:strand:+ start:1231 stop:1515 length:285 start_codon:yes stop_codon:yes gene_type:complete